MKRTWPFGLSLVFVVLAGACTGGSGQPDWVIRFTEADSAPFSPDDVHVVSLYIEAAKDVRVRGFHIDGDEGLVVEALGLCRLCFGRGSVSDPTEWAWVQRNIEKRIPFRLTPNRRIRLAFRISLDAAGKAAINTRCIGVRRVLFETDRGSIAAASTAGETMIAVEHPSPWPAGYQACPGVAPPP